MTPRPPSRRALAALAALGIGAFVVAACSGDEGTTSSSTTATSVESLEYTAFSDPAVPVTVDVGRRFAIVLPADPAHGWRWVVEPVDTTFLTPLGSEFRDDPEALAAATTTTTTAPPPEDTDTSAIGGEVPTTSAPAPVEDPSTTTTAPGPLVQIVSYAGRGIGTTTVTLRYERIGTGDEPPEASQTVEFTVYVGLLPDAPPDVPPDGGPPT